MGGKVGKRAPTLGNCGKGIIDRIARKNTTHFYAIFAPLRSRLPFGVCWRLTSAWSEQGIFYALDLTSRGCPAEMGWSCHGAYPGDRTETKGTSEDAYECIGHLLPPPSDVSSYIVRSSPARLNGTFAGVSAVL